MKPRSFSFFCALLSLLIMAPWDSAFGQSNGVLREVYNNIPGTAVSDLTNAPEFPNNPSLMEVLSAFEAPTDVADYYGQRLSAYVVPPISGAYTFWIASDDGSELYLSSNSDPATKSLIASVPGWTSSREWTKYSSQMSAGISLAAGQRYYIEALMKEGQGGDNLAVRWQLPTGTIEEPIPNNRLLVYGLSAPQITQQPANVTVTEGGTAVFTVQISRIFGASYQWKRGASSIPGATSSAYTLSPVALSDNGAFFSCGITNSQGGTNSSSALLTVQADTTPPTIVSVGNLGDNTLISVLFSEPVESSSGGNRLFYTVNNGVTISAARLSADYRTVTLTTSPLSPGVVYTLTVNNVRDRATTPNKIADNTQQTFTIDFTPLNISALAPNREPIGPSTRRTGLVISEIMYHPTNRPDGKELEFVELYNSQVYAEDLSGYRLTGDISYTFPTNTSIAAGGYLVVAPVPADVQSVYGISGVLGGFTNRLSNGSGTVRLRNQFGAVLLEANYSGDAPWPAAADGAGHSLVLARPTYGEGNLEAWEASDLVGGSPGGPDTSTANPYRTIVINEFLAHTDDPEVDYIELYNYSSAAVNLTGCILTDDPETNRFVLPPTVIPPRGFAAFYQTNMGFSLNAAGEGIYLKNPAATRVLDAIKFKGQENGVATGRYPDGAPGFYRLLSKTPGAPNGRIQVSTVVLNEIMYNPLSGNSQDEFVELYNRGAAAVNLGGWKLGDAISFEFPTNTVIPAGGYVVIANKMAHLVTNYTGLGPANTFGDYGGALGNGERLTLTMPDTVVSTNNNGVVETNLIHITMDEVTFKRGGRWGMWADRGGSSLELVDAHSNHRLASNWADSDETAKSPWVNIEYTGVLDNGSGAADTLHIFLQGAGECLVDNVEVIPSGGGNLVANPTFESNFDNWFPQGTHESSYWQSTGGYGGGKCLHLVTTGRGDTGANRVRATLTTPLAAGTTATLRAKVRWLKGNPEILLRLHGNWLEAYGNISAAQNLGTPGARNSRALANLGPAIHDVSHSPILPADGQPVTIQAQVHDPDSLSSLVLNYRVDPGTNYTSLSMNYNGAGIYSGTIPGQPAGTLVAFYIQAADNAGTPATSIFPNDAPARECLVRFGEFMPNMGRVGTYRFWITQATNQRWSTREKNSNKPLDATFVYGNNRVVYNIGTMYSGSPWHTPGYNGPLNSICDYILLFPEDDLMLGTTDYVMASLGNLDNDDTTQREEAAFWVLGQLGAPTLYRRPVNLFVNGLQRGRVYEDAQQPSGDIVNEYFSDDPNGQLHKIEDWFEFDPTGDVKLFNVDATLQDFTTTAGAKKLARYRWNWRRRAVSDSANDYANLFNLVDAVNAAQPQPYDAQVQRLVDYDEWARVMALEHLSGNWDSYGYNRGKNMYAYKPQNARWTLLAWDIDFVWDNGGDGPTTELNPTVLASATNSAFPVNDGIMRKFLTFPRVQRAWWAALQEAINGPLADSRISAYMNAKYNGLAAAGLPVSPPTGPLSYMATRRSYIQGLLATVAAPFRITSNGGASFSTNRNYISISGTAPIGVADISINGVVFPVTWTSVSNWTATIALNTGANALTVSGLDRGGNAVAGSTATFTVTYTGAGDLPQDHLVINEIMYNSAVPNGAFIELYNTSSSFAFDLSGWKLSGADFTFPGGTIIAPNGFLVIAEDATVFGATYGTSIPIAGLFQGKLKNSGETLRLVKPGAPPTPDQVIDEVSYDSAAPWPAGANGFGPSLQLIDPTLDNNRVANWGVAATNAIQPQPQWQYVTATGTASSTKIYVYLGSSGDVYIDDMKLVAGAAPEAGANLIANGDFETALSGPWITTPNTTQSALSTAVSHAGNSSVHLVCNTNGTTQGDSLYQLNLPLTLSAQYTLSFWYLQKTNAGNLTVRLSGNGIVVNQNIEMPSGPIVQQPATPGATNSIRASLGPFPLVWLNEVQPNNANGPRDNFNERDPWLELYNSGATAADLTGYYLSDNYTNLTKWAFPAATTLGAGQFRLVWLDNQTSQTSGTNLHANFRTGLTNGSVVLARVSGSVTSVVDYLNYGLINNDRSYGAYPDGTPSKRHTFYYATPWAANNDNWPALPVSINEWMASNTRTLRNPADGKFSDWFELYNAGPTNADLSGYYLANSVTNPTQFRIPDGYSVPSGGFLVVWADGDSGNNAIGDPTLHVPFKLSASGESIALFTPTGTLLEGVTFGQQTNDISQGRWPDGNSGQYYFMQTPTPGAANVLGVATNHPPVLSAIANQSVYQGSTLSFAASAIDPDQGQTLSFSLDPGAPLTAYINPSSGVFSWTPSQADPPAVYQITVRATDNGSPPLTDARVVNINVLTPPPLVFTSVTVGQGGALTLHWATQPQKRYRVGYKDALTQTTWSTLADITASGTDSSANDDILPGQNRFYRIELLP